MRGGEARVRAMGRGGDEGEGEAGVGARESPVADAAAQAADAWRGGAAVLVETVRQVVQACTPTSTCTT